MRQTSGREATVDGRARTPHETGFRAGQVGHQTSDLVPLGVTFQGDHALQTLGKRTIPRVHVGVGRAGLDLVDVDTMAALVAE